jgi:AcrR family transcriptional regulator
VVATIREAQKQLTRGLLLAKALELFGDKGYAATTVDDIAVAVGTTRATFYAHFPSKGHLMKALLERSNQMLTEADVPPLKSVVESGERAQIRLWLQRKFDQWAEIRPM